MNSSTAIHTTLARSYLAYWLFSLLGLLADSILRFDAHIPHGNSIAILCFAVGPLLIFWAQATSNTFRAESDSAPMYFHHGPYRFLRNPTHLGIVILVTGYAVVSGSMIFLAVTLVGYIISNILFGKYERILSRHYGEDYDTYKTKVPKIL